MEMDCPNCATEMSELEGANESALWTCQECGGIWVDVSDLKRLLLHHNLPGLESLGGRVDQDALAGHCAQCQVDMVKVIGGGKSQPVEYETCESCGGVFLPRDFGEVATFADGAREIVSLFSHFAKTKAALG